MTYTHEMLEKYINNGNARDEAYNYIDAGMSNEEIRTDIEECLKDCEFEAEEDSETYINAILAAADELREGRNDD